MTDQLERIRDRRDRHAAYVAAGLCIAAIGWGFALIALASALLGYP